MMAGIGTLTLALALAPAVAIVLILLIRRPRAAEALNLVASAVSLLAILLILASRNESSLTFWGSYVIIDGLGTWTILCAAIVYFLASLYAVGYMRLHSTRRIGSIGSTRCSPASRSARLSAR